MKPLWIVLAVGLVWAGFCFGVGYDYGKRSVEPTEVTVTKWHAEDNVMLVSCADIECVRWATSLPQSPEHPLLLLVDGIIHVDNQNKVDFVGHNMQIEGVSK